MNVENLLKQKNPKIEDILMSSDLISLYRNQQKDLISYLTQTKIINQMIKILHKSDKNIISKRIIDLFTSTNKILLKQIALRRETTELLLSKLNDIQSIDITNAPVFIATPESTANDYNLFYQQQVLLMQQQQQELQNNPKSQEQIEQEKLLNLKNHSIITAIMQICVYAFNDWQREMFAIFNSSSFIFPSILKHIEKLPVFSFLKSILIYTEQAKTFLWYYFATLMDEHTTGMEIPEYVQAEFAIRTPTIHLAPEQRTNVINLMALYYQYSGNDAPQELTAGLTQGLPLILQDCNTDPERIAVFKLALYLPNNPTLSLSAVSILECFRLPSELLISGIRYLTQSQYKISPDLAELLLYRIIRNNLSVLIVKETLPLFLEFSASQVMQNTLLAIMHFAYEKMNWKESVQMRTCRIMLTNAICGRILDPLDADFPDLLNHFMEDPPEGYVDQNRLKLLRGKSSQAMPTHFNAVLLWGEEDARKMWKIYPSLNKPIYLRLLNPKKFEDVHFVSETQVDASKTDKEQENNKQKDKIKENNQGNSINKDQTKTSVKRVKIYRKIDEFDTGPPTDNPFLMPPPPESLHISKKAPVILQTVIGPKAALYESPSVVYEVQIEEFKNRKTQTKIKRLCDTYASTTTGECVITPQPRLVRKGKELLSTNFKPLNTPLFNNDPSSLDQNEAPQLNLPPHITTQLSIQTQENSNIKNNPQNQENENQSVKLSQSHPWINAFVMKESHKISNSNIENKNKTESIQTITENKPIIQEKKEEEKPKKPEKQETKSQKPISNPQEQKQTQQQQNNVPNNNKEPPPATTTTTINVNNPPKQEEPKVSTNINNVKEEPPKPQPIQPQQNQIPQNNQPQNKPKEVKKKEEEIKTTNQYLEAILPLINSEQPPAPNISLKGLDLNWINEEINSIKFFNSFKD